MARRPAGLSALRRHRVRPGGRIALSGILAEQAEEVLVLYGGPFAMEPWAEEEGWVCLAGTKRLTRLDR